MNIPDGRYDSRPWNDDPMAPVTRPAAGEELPVEEVLAMLQMPQVMPREVPADVMFRTRFGYRTRALDIRDIINIDDVYGGRVDFSQTPADFSSTSRNDLGQV
jgi:hypothetical protein